MKEPVNPREVLTLEPLDLTGYSLFGSRIMLKLTTEETIKKKIIYKGMKIDDFFEVVMIGQDMKGRGIEVGDFVLMNPDLSPTEVSFIYVEKHKVAILMHHDVFVIRKPGYVSKFEVVGEND